MKGPFADVLYPDLVLFNGNVLTIDDDFSKAEAVAVKNGRIIAVGDNDDVKALAGKPTRRLDLQGSTVLPGIIDSHSHTVMWAVNLPPLTTYVTPEAVDTLEDVLDTVAAAVESSSPGAGIFLWGLDPNSLPQVSDPKLDLHKSDLDKVSPDNPVCVQTQDGSFFWANSRALEFGDVHKDSPDAEGYKIVKDRETGEPTGVIEIVLRFSVYEVLSRLLPTLTEAQRRVGILEATKRLNAYGITSQIEAMLGVDADTMSRGALSNDVIETYTALMNEGELTTRTGIMLNFANFCAPYRTCFDLMKEYLNYVAVKPGFGNDMLWVSGLKIGADWTHFDGTAWMYEPYLPSGEVGSLNLVGETDEEKVEQLWNMMEYAHQRRWSLGIHAIGDRTTDIVADNFAKLMSEDPWDARHYVIHGLFLRPEAAQKMAAHDIGISVQSAWLWHYFYADQELEWIGQERFDYAFPLRMMLDAGLVISNGADAPETEPDWRRGVEAAVRRVSKLTGEVRSPEQRITVEEALRTYTINGAYLDHQDHVKGSIEEGKLADFCIIGDDVLEVEPEKIPEIPILMTILGGDVVHDSEDLEIK